MAICGECVFHMSQENAICNNWELPPTDFVYGIRNCGKLNQTGNCKSYKPLPDNEPIYELKSDEDLAKV